MPNVDGRLMADLKIIIRTPSVNSKTFLVIRHSHAKLSGPLKSDLYIFSEPETLFVNTKITVKFPGPTIRRFVHFCAPKQEVFESET